MLFTGQGRSVLEETALQKNNRAANATGIISSLNNNLTKKLTTTWACSSKPCKKFNSKLYILKPFEENHFNLYLEG